MYKLNHDNDKAVAAFQRYLELQKGQGEDARKRVEGEIEALGGPAVAAKPKAGKKPKGKAAKPKK